MQQEKVSHSAHFVTLTYNTDNVPINSSGYMTLCKRDLQLFFKRLRKLCPERKISYYAVGEYGGKSWRPHYHIILFNANPQMVEDSWLLGSSHFGNVTNASVGYTLKYISKCRRVPAHQNDDRVPEFSLMSKGLGLNYVTDAMKRWHKDKLDVRMYHLIEGGKKISMPRYYKDRIYTETEREVIGFAARKRALEVKYESSPVERAQAVAAAFRRQDIKTKEGSKI